MNQIQKIIQSKLDSLIAKSNGAEAIGHNATKGSLREKYLIDFFWRLIPPKLNITAGVICDAKGRSSKQTDFIIKDNSALPAFLLEPDVSVVPVESVHLIAEIKTTLRTSDLQQVKEARDSFNKLQLAIKPNGIQSNIKIPSVILAFNNDVSEATLKKWMSETNDIIAICIIDEYTLSKTIQGIECHKMGEEKPKYWETLYFASQLFSFLQNSSAVNRGEIQFWPYLLGVKDC